MLGRFRALFSRNKAGPAGCIFAALADEIGFGRLAEIVQSLSDRRALARTAAARLQIGESDLLARLSARLGVPLLLENSARLDAANPEGVCEPDLRRMAALPLLNAQGKICVACVDPGLVTGPLAAAAQGRFMLASWALISRWLDERSEATLAVESAEPALGIHVLRQIISEAARYGGREIEIISQADAIQYVFYTSDNKRASGTIDRLVEDELFQILRANTIAGQHTFQFGDRPARVVEIARARHFRVGADPGRYRELNSGAALGRVLQTASSRQEILLIDDNVTFTRVLERFLNDRGFTCRAATDGEQALLQLQSGNSEPSLIVCDVHMPRMNGREFLLRVKELIADTRPVIMLTSDDAVELELEFLNFGVVAYITKNEDPRILVAHVERILGAPLLHRERKEAA